MRSFKFLTIIVIIAAFGISCYRDPLEGYLTYRLIINNETNVKYEVYQSSKEVSSGSFFVVGTLEARSSMVVRRLVAGVVYTFRLVEGDSLDNPAYEQIIQSNGGNVAWNVGE
ncbi:MAG TPA: hypothetical protein VJ964_08175 [Balneolaceae bacterium]|nr:hypothetical protein [Balneolaceae bacterium]